MFILDPQLQADTIILASLPLCELLLMNDSHYPWFILVPRRRGLRELMELSAADRLDYVAESDFISTFLQRQLAAEKINIAALGNVVAQLHIHHIARFSGDAAWPKPVWGVNPAMPYKQQALDDISSSLRRWAKDETSWKIQWHS